MADTTTKGGGATFYGVGRESSGIDHIMMRQGEIQRATGLTRTKKMMFDVGGTGEECSDKVSYERAQKRTDYSDGDTTSTGESTK